VGQFGTRPAFSAKLLNMLIRSFQNKDKKQIVNPMSEFGGYIEELDLSGRTDFANNGNEYFTDKLIRDTKTKQGIIYVAEINEDIVGFIGGYIEKQTEDELMESKKAVLGVISEFFVIEKYRSKGVGQALIKEVEMFFKESGCTLIRLGVFAPNKLARDFYTKQGYQDWNINMTKEL
jgi:ribosomal protein S18 acetylase RimI-like enzyme